MQTALGGADYTPLMNQVLTFAPGETSKMIGIDVIGDALVEANETFGVVLSNPNNAQIGLGTGIGTILNDDVPGAVTISIGSFSAAEGDAGTTVFSFPVTLSATSTDAVTVQYSTADGTALGGSDYTPQLNQTLTFNPGQTSQTISIAVLGDTAIEPNEMFTVVLSNPSNAGIATGTGTGTILNDDSPGAVQISIGGFSAAEGNAGTTAFTFPVTLSAASAQTVTVQFSTADGTALAGSDYSACLAQTLTFNPGETSKTITIDVIGDVVAEADETFGVTLSNPGNATIAAGGGAATGTILNDDAAAPLTVSIGNGAGLEGNSGTSTITFSVTLSAASTLPVSVLVSTADGTATGGSDFTAFTGQMVSFAPGEISKTVTVEVLGDTTVEATENFTLLLSDPVNAAIGGAGIGMGAIVNDDMPAPPSPQEVMITEADGDQVLIKLSNGTISLEDLEFMAVEGGVVVSKIDLTGKAAQLNGGTLTIEVVSPSGNGFADIGLIDATGVNLKTVSIQGDVTSLIIGAGDGAPLAGKAKKKNKPALQSVSVGSAWARRISPISGQG